MDPQWTKIFNSTKKTRGKRPHPLPLKENEGTKEHHSEPTDTVSGDYLSHVHLCDNLDDDDVSHEGDTSNSIEFDFESESSSDREEACSTLMALVTDSTGSTVTSTDGQG